jgi:uncharacterized membrane protein YbhN (UPF0104 family)
MMMESGRSTSRELEVPIGLIRDKNLMMKAKYQKLHKAFGYVPALIIFPILLVTLVKNIGTFSSQEVNFAAWPLVLSVFLLLFHFSLSGIGWWILVYFLGGRITIYQSVRITVLSLMGRYIPGKVWTILGKIYMADRLGLQKKVAVTASAYEFLFFNLGGLFLFITLKFLYPVLLPGYLFLYVILFFLVIFFVAFPNAVVSILNRILHLRKLEPLKSRLRRSQVLCIFFYYSISWIVTALSFSCFVGAVYSDVSFPLLTGSLIVSNIIGFVFVISPGGLGIREGVMAYVLSAGHIPLSQAILISSACRIWSTAGELLVVMPLYFYRGRIDSEIVKAQS